MAPRNPDYRPSPLSGIPNPISSAPPRTPHEEHRVEPSATRDIASGAISFTVNGHQYMIKDFGAPHGHLKDDSRPRLTHHHSDANDLLTRLKIHGDVPLQRVSSWTVAKEQALSWLQDCTKIHTKCRTHEDCILPTRVIHVGASESEVRLIESNGRVGKYACLSHCWGQTPSIKLLKSNRQAFLKHISWDELQLTYKDAISWCRDLKIPYIWIDSLCIVQDDIQDWNRESVKMAAVYGCCYLTLAASAASNHDEGCRVKLPQDFCAYTGPDGATRRAAVTVTKHGLELGTFRSGGSAPLLKRAWVLQELALSPRVLYFGSSELGFECNSGSTCQCGQKIEPSLSQAMPSPRDLMNLVAWAQDDSWAALVEFFSRMQLSRPTDRLPAISGLAFRTYERRRDRGRSSDEYLAGLWRNTFIVDLGWCHCHHGPRITVDPPTPRAPPRLPHAYVRAPRSNTSDTWNKSPIDRHP
ncbi:hypothetical protein MBLNU230_g3280t1 [Neophaeotheca triangularis]